jgi:hypothetical protein
VNEAWAHDTGGKPWRDQDSVSTHTIEGRNSDRDGVSLGVHAASMWTRSNVALTRWACVRWGEIG